MNPLAAALLAAATAATPVADDPAPRDPQARHGEAIYRSGASPNRNPVVAVTGNGQRLPGTAASCMGCHGRDGAGRSEGGVTAPDIRWPALALSGVRDLPAGRTTPPYDRATLERAITRGIDSGGNRLAPTMPRFELYREDLDALVAWLQTMHLARDPGIADTSVRFGVVLPLSGPAERQGRAMRSILLARIGEINAAGGAHGRTIALDFEDAEGDDAGARLDALVGRTLGILAPYAPPLQRAIAAQARTGVPVIAPVAGLEATGAEPLFTTLPTGRHVMGALAAYWQRLPKEERGTLTIVTASERSAALLEDQLRGVLTEPASVRFVEAAGFTPAAGATPGWILPDTTSGLVATLGEQLRGQRVLAASASVAGVSGTVLSTAERIIVGAPLLPPREHPAVRAAEERLRAERLDAPPPIVTIQALRGIALVEDALKRAGRDLSRDRLVASLEAVTRLDTPGGPLSFGPRQRVGARGATLFAMDPASGRLTLLAPWEAAP